ncbi:lipolytic enzyme, G-D-S-L [Pseudoflavonifractor sp. 524-17]|uniref:SGNH/GDSL hydrolase family protein n=1 Tax=Pseudoflavonifractor sp. 524-17 TaxID=2304577 RepID=UPI00137B2469|nr:SGNH/GDSL hydrolase family protein [Pseudoflavonifractor sp. 524-17]NCE64592.1 lipolytic enzyme, G-D-S-L [Pseudoflavonifractor sp. 524-17]
MIRKRIVCFGDSNTWGYSAESGGRFEDDQRWTQVMAAALGDGYQVVEEGISGRTTVFNDPLNEGLRGMDHLPVSLMSHSPLDLLILMLGTNDCKERFSASPKNIADGVDRLIRKARTYDVWRGESKILVAAPIRIDSRVYTSPVAGEMGAGCVEKSWELPALMEACAKLNQCAFLDCNDCCTVNQVDFMHLDLDSHRRFGERMAEKVQMLLG